MLCYIAWLCLDCKVIIDKLSPETARRQIARRVIFRLSTYTQIIVDNLKKYQYIVYSVLTKREYSVRIVYVELSALDKGRIR